MTPLTVCPECNGTKLCQDCEGTGVQPINSSPCNSQDDPCDTCRNKPGVCVNCDETDNIDPVVAKHMPWLTE